MESDARTGTGGLPEGGFVFLSYSHADAKAARTVVESLEQAGFKVWWDQLISGGERFGSSTSQALEAAPAVVVLWSKASLASHWVHDEAAFARDHHRLVPVSLDGSEPPLGFRQFQYIDASREGVRPGSAAMQRVVASLAAMLERAPGPVAAPPSRSPPRIGRRGLLVAAAVVAIAAAGGWGIWKFAGHHEVSGNSIAVLPFDNYGDAADQAYFSDGLAAELRGRLARNPLLKVMGQASSNQFRGDKEDARTISSRLGVTWLLDGNVRVSGGRVRIAMELIDGESGFTRWSNSFDRPLSNIFQVQQEIAEAVDAMLAVEVGAGEETRQARAGTTSDVAAFDAYLRGRDLFGSQRDEASDRGALAYFEQAIAIDPGYAAARAARSQTLAVIANQYAQAEERQRLYVQAVAEAREAIRLAPELADGHAALGYALFYGRLDAAAAEPHYATAERYGGGSPDVLGRYALFRARQRQFEPAERAIAGAIQLDPLNPAMFKTQGLVRYARGDPQGAITAARRALELSPERATLHGDIGNALVQLDRLDEAEAAFALEKAGLLALPGRAIVAARRGDGDTARAQFEELVRRYGDNGFYQQAQVLAQWGKPEEALDALEKALAVKDSGLVTLQVDPYLDPLRDDPRFHALLQSIHFE
ncbi:MAG: TIR domain-containing protein [Xanthomonadaceae bacterium]|nr:TIR domain-containing protein [Xanthomonadaceae bacterium]